LNEEEIRKEWGEFTSRKGYYWSCEHRWVKETFDTYIKDENGELIGVDIDTRVMPPWTV
jgi:hypothetical protein